MKTLNDLTSFHGAWYKSSKSKTKKELEIYLKRTDINGLDRRLHQESLNKLTNKKGN
tara:strand:+ start:242 stop:412 length:171 start_codon:yes stop_codon:yes gene_type:complete